MSRLGKQPITIPAGVEAKFENGVFSVKGKNGTLEKAFTAHVKVAVEDGAITLEPASEKDIARALWGTYASHVHNMLKGVTEGFERKLEIEGVGYRAEAQGQNLKLNVGFSHPVEITAPEGVGVTVEKNVITLTAADKEVLGQFAANVKKVRPPEPYKGKGIRYQGEFIIRKQGKKAV